MRTATSSQDSSAEFVTSEDSVPPNHQTFSAVVVEGCVVVLSSCWFRNKGLLDTVVDGGDNVMKPYVL